MATATGTRKIKVDTLINWGASIVIIGLMLKLLHWDGGEWMIGVGLCVESCLFFILGIQTIYESNDTVAPAPKPQAPPPPPPAPKNTDLDQLLSTSLNHQIIEKLNKGFEQFNKTVASVNDVASQSYMTKEMAQEIENATDELRELKKNLAELNNVYRAQLEAFRRN
jgi:hypothetical protein